MATKTNFQQILKPWVDRLCQGMVESASELLQEEMGRALQEEYYDEYNPDFYERTYNFKNNSYYPFMESGNDIYIGGIILSPANMDEYEGTKWSKEKIWGVDLEGWHGKNFKGTSPLESIRSFANSNYFINQIQRAGLAKAGKLL